LDHSGSIAIFAVCSMTPFLKNDLAARGYVLLPAHAPKMDTITIATEIGEAITPWERGLIQTLVPRASATPNTYSGTYGLGSFPFHTDLAHWRQPPRFLLLRCITGYVDVQTLLIDGHALAESVTTNLLGRAVVKPRRPQSGAISLFRLWEAIDNDNYRLRWDGMFLKPASKVAEIADHCIRTYLADAQPVSIALTRPGDTLLIDNWRMLHARSPIALGQENRKIERIYLERLH
jgi:L-asparagine oxygenase